jgi:hypothetical protein
MLRLWGFACKTLRAGKPNAASGRQAVTPRFASEYKLNETARSRRTPRRDGIGEKRIALQKPALRQSAFQCAGAATWVMSML